METEAQWATAEEIDAAIPHDPWRPEPGDRQPWSETRPEDDEVDRLALALLRNTGERMRMLSLNEGGVLVRTLLALGWSPPGDQS